MDNTRKGGNLKRDASEVSDPNAINSQDSTRSNKKARTVKSNDGKSNAGKSNANVSETMSPHKKAKIPSCKKSWEKMLGQLKLYQEENGNCNVQRRDPANKQLARWVSSLRTAKKKGTLSEEQERALDAIGFVWDCSMKLDFDEMLEQLKFYKEENGNCVVPSRDPANKQLARWVSEKRTAKKKGTLSEEQERALDAIGFVWEVGSGWLDFDKMLEQLQLYREENGNCNVPSKYPANQQLANWVISQRKAKKNKKLTKEREQKLDAIGFVWDCSKKLDFDERLEQLKLYKTKHGDCNVPSKYPINQQLARWVGKRRIAKKKGTLSEEQERALDAIGFVWEVGSGWLDFDKMLEQLKLYREENGNCNVPWKYPANQQLANWVSSQRIAKKDKRLTKEREQKLDAIGFVWDCSKKLDFDAMLEQLKLYKAKHGDCNVHYRYPANKQLLGWVRTQRKLFKNGTLTPDREQHLRDIGFDFARRKLWTPEETKQVFQAIVEFKTAKEIVSHLKPTMKRSSQSIAYKVRTLLKIIKVTHPIFVLEQRVPSSKNKKLLQEIRTQTEMTEAGVQHIADSIAQELCADAGEKSKIKFSLDFYRQNIFPAQQTEMQQRELNAAECERRRQLPRDNENEAHGDFPSVAPTAPLRPGESVTAPCDGSIFNGSIFNGSIITTSIGDMEHHGDTCNTDGVGGFVATMEIEIEIPDDLDPDYFQTLNPRERGLQYDMGSAGDDDDSDQDDDHEDDHDEDRKMPAIIGV